MDYCNKDVEKNKLAAVRWFLSRDIMEMRVKGWLDR